MAVSPYTTKRDFQFRGPDSSDDYNARLEQNFKDLVYLYNKTRQLDSDMTSAYAVFLKELMGLAHAITDYETRLAALESANKSIAFTTDTQIDNDRFNATAFNINLVDRLNFQAAYNITTLPLVSTSSMSKIKFTNNDGTYNIPPSLETIVVPITPSADDGTAVIDTTQPYSAIVGKPGSVWERNIIRSSPDLTNGAQMYFYIRIPDDLSAVANTNAIQFNPFPMKTVDILEIAYTTDNNPVLGVSAGSSSWTLFNASQTYYQAPGAAGNLMPGAWSGDEILNSAGKLFYFDPKPITAIRIKMRQRNYYLESSKVIYSYGFSKFDIRYDKFLDTGKTMIRFDAPAGKTVSTVKSLTPQAFNTPEYLVNDVFSYRVIWETSYGSNSYTLTPVPNSQRVWIEVTLKTTPNGGTPSLNGLILKYT